MGLNSSSNIYKLLVQMIQVSLALVFFNTQLSTTISPSLFCLRAKADNLYEVLS